MTGPQNGNTTSTSSSNGKASTPAAGTATGSPASQCRVHVVLTGPATTNLEMRAKGCCCSEFQSSPADASTNNQAPTTTATIPASVAASIHTAGSTTSTTTTGKRPLSTTVTSRDVAAAAAGDDIPSAKRARTEEELTISPIQKTKTKKKKAKMPKYISLLKRILMTSSQNNTKPRTLEEEREALRAKMGGGNFEKVAKI